MGSLNSPGDIQIVDKQNAAFRNEGGSLVVTSGLLPQTGPTSSKVSTTLLPQGHDRPVAEFGTQPDRAIVQRSVTSSSPVVKVTSSEDKDLDGLLVDRHTEVVAPTAASQPEIANKPVSQHSTYHTGGRVVIRNSNHNNLIARQANDSVRPGP